MKRPARRAVPLEVKIRACLWLLDAPKMELRFWPNTGDMIANVNLAHDAVIAAARRNGLTKSQFETALLVAMGFDPDKPIHWDHSPALGLRPVNTAGDDYTPPQLDPRHLYPMTPEDHARKTSGAAPGEGKATTANSDLSKIAKVKRILDREASPAPQKRQWPARKMQSRGFEKRRK